MAILQSYISAVFLDKIDFPGTIRAKNKRVNIAFAIFLFRQE